MRREQPIVRTVFRAAALAGMALMLFVEAAQAADDAPDFSRMIRMRLPSGDPAGPQ